MKRWKVIAAVLLIFASGAATGALAFRAATREAPSRPARSPQSLVDARFLALKRMKGELNLGAAQVERIDRIVEDGRRRTHLIWDTFQPQFREELRHVRDRIRSELEPEQRARFDELLRRSRDHRGVRTGGGSNLTSELRPDRR